QQGGKFPDPIMALTINRYANPTKPTLDEIAKEINGADLATGKQMTSFALLKSDGTTTAGDWIYTGSYLDTGNLMKRRNGVQDIATNDPTGMGFFPTWAWSWPLNRRVLYNRASADLNGVPWDTTRPGIKWDATQKKWVGDDPYVATSYRLTEHEHYVTQHVPLLAGLQPSPFVEIPEELASQKGIHSGDRVRVRSKRGKIEVLALVTKRLGPSTIDGKKVFQVGIPIHWGFVGVSADADPSKGANWLANALPPFVGDAIAYTPE